MKKILALILALIMCASLLVSCTPTGTTEETTLPEVNDPYTDESYYTLRIEGNKKNIYYGKQLIPGSTNLKDAILTFDASTDEVTIVGAENDYITEINGERAGEFDGWDGWCILVNGELLSVAASEATVEPGDEVVIFYGDPWGVGTIFPKVGTKKGALAIVTAEKEPIPGITVILNGEYFVTNDDGAITGLEGGEYSLQIELYADNGMTLILRLAPDFTVRIP